MNGLFFTFPSACHSHKKVLFGQGISIRVLPPYALRVKSWEESTVMRQIWIPRGQWCPLHCPQLTSLAGEHTGGVWRYCLTFCWTVLGCGRGHWAQRSLWFCGRTVLPRTKGKCRYSWCSFHFVRVFVQSTLSSTIVLFLLSPCHLWMISTLLELTSTKEKKKKRKKDERMWFCAVRHLVQHLSCPGIPTCSRQTSLSSRDTPSGISGRQK